MPRAPAAQPQAPWAPGLQGRQVVGMGEPLGASFTLLPPPADNIHSALTASGLRRWPPNYRPREQELLDWGIQMDHYWWTHRVGDDRNLPVGWYEHDDVNRLNDPAWLNTVWAEDSEIYRDGDQPGWMSPLNEAEEERPQQQQPQQPPDCSIM